MNARERLSRTVAALCVALLVLAGCSSMPTSGPVIATRAATADSGNIGWSATGPVPGAEPEAIIRGFLTASAAGNASDFAVARQFLSADAAAQWSPRSQVRIYSDTRVPSVTRTPTGAVRLTIDAEASIDEDGRYVEAPPDAVITTEFSLAKNADGEWRIIDLDDGLLLSRTIFESQYSYAPVYFLTADSRSFVADPRWMPRSALATTLMTELLQGPSPWLESGVRTAVPAGTRLNTQNVSIEDGVATVDLTSEVLASNASDQNLIRAQIEETLGVLPQVQSVELTVEQAPLESGGVPDLETYPFEADGFMVLQEGNIPAHFQDGALEPLDLPDGFPATFAEPAMSYGDEPFLAGVVDGSELLVIPTDGRSTFSVLRGNALIPPSIDIYRWMWTGEQASTGSLRAMTDDGRSTYIDAPWLNDVTVTAVQVSREGARVAVAWQEDGETKLALAAVMREIDGTPRGLGEPVIVGQNIDTIGDIAWTGSTSLAVLGTSIGGEEPVIFSVRIGGPVTTISSVPSAVSLTAAVGEDTIMVGTDQGQVLERSVGAWRSVLQGVKDPTLPG